jgi:hypothetical protein
MNAIILSWPVRAISSTAPVRRRYCAGSFLFGSSTSSWGSLRWGYFLRACGSRLSSNGRIFLICACFPKPRCPIPHLHTLARCLYAISAICSALLGSVNGVLLVPSPAAVAITMTMTMTPRFPNPLTRVLTPPHSRAPTSGSWLVDYLDRVVGRTRVSTADAPPHMPHSAFIGTITMAW